VKEIFFDAKFDCIICLNGEIPSKTIFNKIANIPIFAADGAALKLYKIEVEPTKIIGDLDSFSENFHEKIKDKIIKIDDQNTNDFEKVLLFVIENNYKNCLIFGINGGEFEHSLNNWSVLAKYSEKLNLCVWTENRYGFYVSKNISIQLRKNETVSLIPCPIAVISSKNLKWELSHYSLEIGVSEGARNSVISENVEIVLHQGKYFLFIDARLPFCFTTVI